MFNLFNNSTKLLSELGTIELKPNTQTYLFRKEIGKVNLVTLDPNSAHDFFTTTNTLNVGELFPYIKQGELGLYLTLEYRVYLSSKSLTNSSFTKLYADIKEDLSDLAELFELYLNYLTNLISKINKPTKETKPNKANFDFTKFDNTLENIINNLPTTEEE